MGIIAKVFFAVCLTLLIGNCVINTDLIDQFNILVIIYHLLILWVRKTQGFPVLKGIQRLNDGFHLVMVIIAKVFFAVCVPTRVRVWGCVGVFVNPTMTTDSESCPLLWPLQPLSPLGARQNAWKSRKEGRWCMGGVWNWAYKGSQGAGLLEWVCRDTYTVAQQKPG